MTATPIPEEAALEVAKLLKERNQIRAEIDSHRKKRDDAIREAHDAFDKATKESQREHTKLSKEIARLGSVIVLAGGSEAGGTHADLASRLAVGRGPKSARLAREILAYLATQTEPVGAKQIVKEAFGLDEVKQGHSTLLRSMADAGEVVKLGRGTGTKYKLPA